MLAFAVSDAVTSTAAEEDQPGLLLLLLYSWIRMEHKGAAERERHSLVQDLCPVHPCIEN